MSLSLKPQHLKRYKEIAMLFFKYGSAEMVSNINVRAELADDAMDVGDSSKSPEELTDELERMGPTFVKLGQILSSRADLLPESYLKALSRLQDKVKAFSYEEVEAAITDELGVRLSKAFQSFEVEPVAAASLGQVHRATLRDGRQVVVKIQRPGIRKQIADDLEVLEEIVGFLNKHSETARRYQFVKIFEEFQKTLISELDYNREAANLTQVGENLKEFENIVVPRPVRDFTSRGVLTMDFVTGKKITSIEPLERMELNGALLADELFKAYLKQVLVDGLFHADPHPGNVFLTDDHKVALLDLGMVGRTTPQMQEHLIKLLISISEGEGDTVVKRVIEMSQTTPYFKPEEFRRAISGLVVEQHANSLKQIDVGRILLEVGKGAGENGLYVPTELTMLGKTLLQLDEIGRGLDPKFNPNQAVKRHVSEILNLRLRKDATAEKLYSSLLEVKDFVGGLPNRVNKVLDTVGNSDFEVKVKVNDVELLLEGFQKVANRITTGLVLAALIIGASLLMNIKTSFTIFGYPGMAILCFLTAAGGGFWLVFNILVGDHHTRKKDRLRLP